MLVPARRPLSGQPGSGRVVLPSDLMLTLRCLGWRKRCSLSNPAWWLAQPFFMLPFPILLHWQERVESDGCHDCLRRLLQLRLGSLPMSDCLLHGAVRSVSLGNEE